MGYHCSVGKTPDRFFNNSAEREPEEFLDKARCDAYSMPIRIDYTCRGLLSPEHKKNLAYAPGPGKSSLFVHDTFLPFKTKKYF